MLLENEGITISRVAKSFDNDGLPQVDSTTPLTALANIQPLKGNEILQLPEGDRDSENLWCYTSLQLQVNDEVTRDLDGIKYEVQESQNWAVFGMLQHYKVRLRRKERQ